MFKTQTTTCTINASTYFSSIHNDVVQLFHETTETFVDPPKKRHSTFSIVAPYSRLRLENQKNTEKVREMIPRRHTIQIRLHRLLNLVNDFQHCVGQCRLRMFVTCWVIFTLSNLNGLDFTIDCVYGMTLASTPKPFLSGSRMGHLHIQGLGEVSFWICHQLEHTLNHKSNGR